MTLFKLAWRNLRGAGIRTWLNGFALSLAFVAIIFGQGLLQGVNRQAENASIQFEVGGGQFWQKNYDPYDPLTLEDAHSEIPEELKKLIANGVAVPILIIPGSIYSRGRMVPVQIKGIVPEQRVLSLPTQSLADTTEELPVLLGARMAKSAGVDVGDYITVQWRDALGAFDAREAKIVKIMATSVGTVDEGQVWVPLDRLWELTGLKNQATVITVKKGFANESVFSGWTFRPPEFLLRDLRQMVKMKTVGQSIFFIVLFLLAMLAIFDTQVFSIFRRKREIGMLVALGMTRAQVIFLFTIEGAFYGVLAAILGAIYGIPLFAYLNANGIAMPGGSSWGFALEEKLYPAYSSGLILGTTLLVLIAATFVSWLPTRRIARLKPTDALRGKSL
ncbi:MAG: FtsX-like permease family protein [candidate division WOR-3 bacterium]